MEVTALHMHKSKLILRLMGSVRWDALTLLVHKDHNSPNVQSAKISTWAITDFVFLLLGLGAYRIYIGILECVVNLTGVHKAMDAIPMPANEKTKSQGYCISQRQTQHSQISKADTTQSTANATVNNTHISIFTLYALCGFSIYNKTL